jgi:hypothetical protein
MRPDCIKYKCVFDSEAQHLPWHNTKHVYSADYRHLIMYVITMAQCATLAQLF